MNTTPKTTKPAAKPKRKLKNPGSGKPNAMMKAKAIKPKLEAKPTAQEQVAAMKALYRDAPDQDMDRRPGRPTMFTPELGSRICRLLADGTPALAIWLMEGMPSESTFFRWMQKTGPEYDLFREEVARAREHRANTRAFKIESLQARLTDPDLSTRSGLRRLDPQEAKVAIEAERILMEVEAPKKYGKALTLKGDKDAPLVTRTLKDLSDEELAALAQGGLKGSDA